MDKSAIAKVNKHVYRKHPEFSKVAPNVKSSGSNYQLTYKAKVNTPDGKTMNLNLRVIADENGKVIRLSTSK